jgi:transposase
MKRYRYIKLSPSENSAISEGIKFGKTHHFRERCRALDYSNKGETIPQIAYLLGKRCETIRHWFNNWEQSGISGLEIQPGRGLKPILDIKSEDLIVEIKKKVTQQPLKLLNILEGISTFVGRVVSKNTLITFLKKLGYSYRRIRKRLKKSPDEADYNRKLDELTDLIRLEKSNFLTIYYADESGFNETPCVPSGWQLKEESLSMPSQRGQRWNVFGIMSSNNQLFANKTKGSIKSVFVIASIDEFANSSERAPRAVIVIDNATIHHSEEFKAKIPQWAELGVEIFYLPTYSPHLNRIETFWRKCKYEWLLPEDYQSWKHLTLKIEHILANFGTEYKIKFKEF